MKKKTFFYITAISLIIISIFIFAIMKLYPFIKNIDLLEFEIKLESYTNSLGWKGIFFILFLQVLQVFFAIIPGEIIEIAAGALYGPILGTLICLIGLILGTLLIYYSISLLTKKSLEKYKEKLKTYSFLNNPKKIHVYFFILFIIPGIPKDIFIYLVPFLPIKITTFLIISSIARMPSILSSTFIGDSLISGNYLSSIIVFAIFFILGLLSILFFDKILNLFKENNKEDTMEN